MIWSFDYQTTIVNYIVINMQIDLKISALISEIVLLVFRVKFSYLNLSKKKYLSGFFFPTNFWFVIERPLIMKNRLFEKVLTPKKGNWAQKPRQVFYSIFLPTHCLPCLYRKKTLTGWWNGLIERDNNILQTCFSSFKLFLSF